MSTTSGRCSRTTSAAADPSETDATTSMSERRPSRSSSASRKTWLSSTRTRRIGPSMRRRLFRGEEQRVMRLAARVDLQLEVGMALADAVEETVEVGRVCAGQQRQEQARLGEQRLGNLLRHLLEALADRDRLAV